MKTRLQVILFAVLVSGIFGIIDYLLGLVTRLGGLVQARLGFMLKSLAYGQLVYLSAGLVLGILFLLFLSFWRFFPGSSFRKESDYFALELGFLAGLSSFFLMMAFTLLTERWKLLFIKFTVFGFLAIFAGTGVKNFWEKFLEKFFGGPLKGVFILFQALAVSTMFIIFWVLKFPLSSLGKILMLTLALGLFLFSIFFARICLKKSSKGAILVYLLFLLLGLSLPLFGYEKRERKPLLGKPQNALNIIWIIADACRPEALGIYSGKNPTPNLDQLGREGVLFTNAYSQGPWTIPSVFSMLTSFYPSVFQTQFQFRTYYGTTEKMEPFPERLQRYGYYTGAVNANDLFEQPQLLGRGFDRVINVANRSRLKRTENYLVIIKIHYLLRRFLGLSLFPDSTGLVTQRTQRFLSQVPSPFFLWVHYFNPHEPINPPPRFIEHLNYQGPLKPPFTDSFRIDEDLSHPQIQEVNLGLVQLEEEDKRFVRELYLAYVRYLDERIGELIRFIKKRGLEKNTILIFTADHGEELWDHGEYSHGQSLYEELLRVPLIIWGAGFKPKVIEEPVDLISLVPTLAELIRIEPNPLWQGTSLYPALLGDSWEMKPKPIFAEGTIRPEPMKAIRLGEYKLIVQTVSGKKLLFNLSQDPREQENLYSKDSLIAQELEQKLNLWEAQNLVLKNKLRTQTPSPEERKEFTDRLRALGYIK